MPQVPIQTSPTQTLAGGNTPYLSARGSTPQFRDYAGAQAKDMGNSLTQAGQAMVAIQDKIDDTKAREMDTKFSAVITDAMQGENGFLRQKGEAPSMLFAQTSKTLADQRDELAATLSGGAREQFMRLSDVRMGAASDRMTTHAGAEFDGHRIRVLTDSIDSSVGEAVRNHQDPKYFAQNIARAEQDVIEAADLSGLPVDGALRRLHSKVSVGVISDMAINNNFTEAKKWLDSNYEDMTLEDRQRAEQMIQDGYDREQGDALADTARAKAGAPEVNQVNIINTVVGVLEGSTYIENDGGRGPSKFGITQKTFPKEDIKNLTPQRAAELYKKLWKEGNFDAVPANMRAIGFSAYINMGPKTAKKLLAEANGDPIKFQKLREQYYRDLAKDPKHKKNLKGWLTRLSNEMDAFYGSSSLEDQISDVQGRAENKEQADNATANLRKTAAEAEAVKAQDQNILFNQAMDIRDAGGTVPLEVWRQLSAAQKQQFRNPIQNTPQAILDELEVSPELWDAAGLTPYRGLMSTKDFKSFLSRGSDGSETQSVNSVLFNDVINNSEYKLLNKGTPTQKKKRAALEAAVLRRINATEKAYNRDLTNTEKEELMRSMIRKVKVKAVAGFLGWKWNSTTEMPLYAVKNPEYSVYSEVSEQEKQAVDAALDAAGIPKNSTTRLAAWLHMTTPKD